MASKRTITPALRRKIDEINQLIKKADEKGINAESDFGSTVEMDVDFRPIRVKSQFVTIESKRAVSLWSWGYGKERFNVNDEDSLGALNFDLRYIKRALVKGLKRGY